MLCSQHSHIIIVYIIIVILVQKLDSAESNDVSGIEEPSMENPLNMAFQQSKDPSLSNFVSNKDDNDDYGERLLMKQLGLNKGLLDGAKPTTQATGDKTLNKLKHALSKFLSSHGKQNVEKRDAHMSPERKRQQKLKRKFKRVGKKNRSDEVPKWGSWTKWSSCNVSCGKGREIRWRHCKGNCKDVEIEMEEKSCQLPACPQKLFGILKL